jgi:hypothetical protein
MKTNSIILGHQLPHLIFISLLNITYILHIIQSCQFKNIKNIFFFIFQFSVIILLPNLLKTETEWEKIKYFIFFFIVILFFIFKYFNL